MDGIPQDHASDDDTHTCRQRTQHIHSRIRIMGMGVSRLPQGIALDTRCMALSNVCGNIRRSALVRHGRIRSGINPHSRRIPSLPKDHPARNRPSLNEVRALTASLAALDLL